MPIVNGMKICAWIVLALAVAGCVGPGRGRPVAKPLVFISSPQEAKARVVGKTASARGGNLYVFLDPNGTGLAWQRGDQTAERVTWTLKSGAQMKKEWRPAPDIPDTYQFVSLSFPPSGQMPKGHMTDLHVDTLTIEEGVGPPPARP